MSLPIPHDPLVLRNRNSRSTCSFSAPPVIRASSTSSIAGDAVFCATPPLLVSRPSSPEPVLEIGEEPEEQPPLTPTFPFKILHTTLTTRFRLILRQLRRKRRLSLLLALSLATYLILARTIPPTLAILHLAHYKVVDHAYDRRWGWPLASPCSLRKKPVVWVRDGGRAALVWETGGYGEGTDWALRLRREGDAGLGDVEVRREVIIAETAEQGGRTVYTAALSGLEAGKRYTYDLIRRQSSPGQPSVVERKSFTWIGHSPAPAAGADFSVPRTGSSSLGDASVTVHIPCLADNQFNLRVYHRILRRISSFSRSLPRRYFSCSLPQRNPHLILHAGDVVQNPGNLAQWQTDFWDPLIRALPSAPPILLARGNHDWDPTGSNVYAGGASPATTLRDDWASFLASRNLRPEDSTNRARGTYYSFSPHPRFRILVLDSNLPTKEEQDEQERWLEWELGMEEWKRASIRAVVVHAAPWIEWWDRKAWVEGGEREWSSHVRHRLLPLLAQHHCTLVLSGHSHAYTRGFLPYTLVPSFTRVSNSQNLSSLAQAAVRVRSWEKTASVRLSNAVEEPGMLLVTFGGAGGTLDTDKVEDWGFMSKSMSAKHHFGWMAASFSSSEGEEPEAMAALEVEHGRRRRKGESPRVYASRMVGRCREGEKEVRDAVEWRAVGVDGREMDRVWVVGKGCV
ncbi:hypothetical protein JCM11641_004759 [Rhodosporidiobolus odoratus]